MKVNIQQLMHYLSVSASRADQQAAILRFQYYEKLRDRSAKESPKDLIAFGQKIYSQNEEDGIILEIFKRIGTTNKVFVEFGVETGLECNTRALLFCGWRGLWIDGNEKSIQSMEQQLPRTISSGQLSVLNAFITRDNINKLILSKIPETEIDLLSVDIDGNDYHVLSAITCIKPRVIVIEYNAKFPPPIQYCQKYNENHRWDGSDDFGSSIAFLDKNLNNMGYKLVGCNVAGSNAFFVKKALLKNKFNNPNNAEHHYQPARYFLLGLTSGHFASNSTIENSILINKNGITTTGKQKFHTLSSWIKNKWRWFN